MATAGIGKTVCVTGAGGFVASSLVKLLLSKGYFVHGTVRQPGNEKYDFLLKLERASENLKLFKADLLNYESLYSAIVGCSAVFHVASPVPSSSVPNPEASLGLYYMDSLLSQVEVVEPAVKGTTNVLEASLEAKVERVVFVSSQAAVSVNPKFSKDEVIDESCWSDKEYCRKTENWYCYSKTEAELQALDFAKRTGLALVTICPTLILGPVLQSTVVNASSLVLLKLLKGCESLENKHRWIVDVRDLADAILMAYEKPEAEGRYICTAHSIKTQELVEKLRTLYPNYSFPKNYIEVDYYTRLSTEKLQRLGWRYRSLEETLVDSVESYKEAVKIPAYVYFWDLMRISFFNGRPSSATEQRNSSVTEANEKSMVFQHDSQRFDPKIRNMESKYARIVHRPRGHIIRAVFGEADVKLMKKRETFSNYKQITIAKRRNTRADQNPQTPHLQTQFSQSC
ncbi:cinnamoyl-CoA reductase 2-like [Senna tora]|uniref:Cinnamoyl-CoA reductase 2-like n=1 Tax=Senna tora TaxID=362788 RepID=A0A835CJ63_9FABA|nr:cinnamoyl-CoA reductase 2-like [Senna tora]